MVTLVNGEVDMTISEQGLEFVKRWERLELRSYLDSAGRWTCGYGHTRGIGPDMVCDEQTALNWLRDDMAEAEAYLHRLVQVPLKQHEYDAVASWFFNVGAMKIADTHTIALLNHGQKDAFANALLLWCRAGRKVLHGLVRRRHAERRLFLEGNY